MRTSLPLALATLTAAGFIATPAAYAVIQSRVAEQHPAEMCQMSIPSIDTKVRPKATGYNNEGTTNVFVICAPPSDEGGNSSTTRVILWIASMDGNSHSVSCTAVNGSWPGNASSVYTTKTQPVASSAAGGGNSFAFVPADFGSDDSTLQPSISITCNLPPKTSINNAYTYSTTDVGS